MFAINPQARISLQELRVKVRAIKRFNLTKVELQRAGPDVKDAVKGAVNTRKSMVLTSGTPHTLVARKIINLTAEDFERLESEARAEARDAALLQENDARRSRCAEKELSDEEVDAAAYPLFLSPVFSLSLTAVALDATPRPHHAASFDADLLSMPDEADSDSDDLYLDSDSDSDSDATSAGPVTPESHPAADVDIAAVPDISLDGPCGAGTCVSVPSSSVAAVGGRAKLSRRAVPEIRRGPRRVWWL